MKEKCFRKEELQEIRLTGGVFFSFIASYMQKQDSNEPIVLRDLFWTIYPDKNDFDNPQSKGCSVYKSCDSDDYLSFIYEIKLNGTRSSDIYMDTIVRSYSNYLSRICWFLELHQYSEESAKELVYHLMHLIELDTSIDDDYMFYVCENGKPLTKAQLLKQSEISFQSFIAGVWAFSCLRSDLNNKSGKRTYDRYFPYRGSYQKRYLKAGDLGKPYAGRIDVNFSVLCTSSPPKWSVSGRKKNNTQSSCPNICDDQIKMILSVLQPAEQPKNKWLREQDRSFSSRKWITTELSNRANSPIVFLFGDPGSGKTRLIAHCVVAAPNESTLFCFLKYSDGEDAGSYVKRVLLTLAAQMCEKSQTFCNNVFQYIEKDIKQSAYAADPYGAAYGRLFHKSWNDLKSLFLLWLADVKEQVTIYLDALDEAERVGQNPLVSLLPDLKQSKKCRLVISCRPLPSLISLSKNLGADCISLSNAECIKDDILRFITEYCSNNTINISTHDKMEICKKADGNYYYAKLVLDAFNEQNPWDLTIGSLPNGLNSLLQSIFLRIQNHPRFADTARLPLMLLLSLKGSANMPLFCEIMGQDFDLTDFLNIMNGTVINSSGKLIFYHKSLYDWLINSETFLAKNYLQVGITLYFEYSSQQYDLMVKSNMFSPEFFTEPEFYLQLRSIYSSSKEYLSCFQGSPIKPKTHFNNQKATKILHSIPFLFSLQMAAYFAADLGFSKEIADTVWEMTPSATDEEIHIKSALYRFGLLDCLFADRQKCTEVLNQIEERYGKRIQKYPDVCADYYLDRIWDLRMNGENDAALLAADKLYISLKNNNFEEHSNSVSMIHYYRGTALYNLRRWGEAKHELELCLQNPSLDPSIQVAVENLLGWCCFRVKKYSDERDHFERSLQMRRKLYGESSRFTATGLDAHSRGILHTWKEHHDRQAMQDGLDESRKAQAIVTKIYGESCPWAARCLDTQALIYCELGELEKAENTIAKSLDIRNRYLDKHQSDFNAKKDYATTLEYVADIFSRH